MSYRSSVQINVLLQYTKLDGELEIFHMKGLQIFSNVHLMKGSMFKTDLFINFLVVVLLLLLFSNDDRD